MLSTLTKGRQMVDVLSTLGVQAACVGNHGGWADLHLRGGRPHEPPHFLPSILLSWQQGAAAPCVMRLKAVPAPFCLNLPVPSLLGVD